MKSPATGKVYWIADILPEPTYNAYPRYPLTIAEFDCERLCIIKNSVRVIQDLPRGALKERRYSNFGHYVDRVTGEFVLTLPEEPKTTWEDYTGDAVRYKITLLE